MTSAEIEALRNQIIAKIGKMSESDLKTLYIYLQNRLKKSGDHDNGFQK